MKLCCLVQIFSLPQPKFPPFSFLPSAITPSLLASNLSLRHCFQWSILPGCITFFRRRRGAVGACGGVCSADQLETAVAAGPHMFTGSIPPVESPLGLRWRRTGCGSSWNRSRLTVKFQSFVTHTARCRGTEPCGAEKFDVLAPVPLCSSCLPCISHHFYIIVYKCRLGSRLRRLVRVFPPPLQLAGSREENKQVERRKIGSRLDVEVV